MKNILIVDGNGHGRARVEDMIGRMNLPVESYSDSSRAFRRLIRNNYDFMVASLSDNCGTIDMRYVIRANCNIGKHALVIYSGWLQKMIFCLLNMDILDRIEFLPCMCDENTFRDGVMKLLSRPPVPFGVIFNRLI